MQIDTLAAPALTNDRLISDLTEAAKSVAPLLRARAPEGEANRRIADDLIDEIAERGLFKVTLPTAFGGYAQTGAASVAVVEQLAFGDASPAWMVMNIHAAMWAAGMMPERAQDDIWGDDPAARVCTVTTPRGVGGRAPGGRILKGLWPFASGCLHSSWVALTVALLDDAGQMEDIGIAFVPMSDLVIRDDWNVSGLRGTGSNTLEVNDVFVPNHRIASMMDLMECRPLYERADKRSLYYGASLSSVFAVVVFGMVTGLGESAFEAFTGSLAGREVAYSQGVQQIASNIIRMHVGEARVAIDAARLMAADCNAMLDRAACAGQSLEPPERAKVRVGIAWTARKVLESTQLMMADSGGRGLSDSSPLPRILRDLQALNNHGIVNPFQTMESYGAMLLGQPQAVALR
jgi:alkylation response protein AidB-like acyl-CoA dehydrogenase